MKILFIGMGSIGQRHLQNLRSLYGKEMKCFAVRTTLHNTYIKDGIARLVNDLAGFYKIEVFKSLKEALNEQEYDAVFITNPSSLHSKMILTCLDYRVNIFVEKPLCISTNEAREINDKLSHTNSILYVGYQTHFDPIYKKVRDCIRSNGLGSVVSARFEWCTFLPDHHKYEDYQSSYAAREDLGGGVLLGLSHEIDVLLNFFGVPTLIKAVESTNRNLNISADDTMMVLCKYFEHYENQFSLSLVLSYSQVFETRGFRIHLENGFIDCDWNKGTVNIVDRAKLSTPEIFQSKMTRNQIFCDQTKYFIDAVRRKDTSITNIENSLKILNFIENTKMALI